MKFCNERSVYGRRRVFGNYEEEDEEQEGKKQDNM